MSILKKRQDQSRVGGRRPAGICHGFRLSAEAGLAGYRLERRAALPLRLSFVVVVSHTVFASL